MKPIAVLQRFINRHGLSAALSQRGITKPSLPAETRWSSARDSYDYYHTDWAALVDIAGIWL